LGISGTDFSISPGGLTTVRGIGFSITQFSTLMQGQTITLRPSGRGNGARPWMGL
jgi:hypothetical protein